MNYLIVGLGNVGDEYASTRHNMGFMALDAFAKASNAIFMTLRYGDITTVRHKGRNLYLLKPSTYMNLSGNAVRYWLQKLELPVENLLVICDDLNLPFGTVRMRRGGSNGGHNGLRNIEETLGTTEYCRIRIGIGNSYPKGTQIDYVIGQEMSEGEKAALPEVFDKIIAGLKDYVTMGPERAMNALNTRKKQKNDD